MKFIVDGKVFEKLDNLCFGVVIGKGIDNEKDYGHISSILDNSMANLRIRFQGQKIKETEEISPYREAFRTLGINPNKYMSSIEAMSSRILKNKDLPNINPIVNLSNALSLKHMVPLGAHDMDRVNDNIYVRFSNGEDRFIPFGGEKEEILEPGELIYCVGDKVKTRRWIWRQSEEGKITGKSKNIFFPIDGFEGFNEERVIEARDELANVLREHFNCEVSVHYVNKDNREVYI